MLWVCVFGLFVLRKFSFYFEYFVENVRALVIYIHRTVRVHAYNACQLAPNFMLFAIIVNRSTGNDKKKKKMYETTNDHMRYERKKSIFYHSFDWHICDSIQFRIVPMSNMMLWSMISLFFLCFLSYDKLIVRFFCTCTRMC